MADSSIELKVHLTEDEALALAEFFKRVQPEDYGRRAGDEAEAGLMYLAGLAIQAELRRQGFDPR